MGIVVQLGQDQGIPELAEKVAGACRNRLLEPKAVAVSFNHISEQLGTDPRLIQTAVAWLERQGRVEIRPFRLRSALRRSALRGSGQDQRLINDNTCPGRIDVHGADE